MAAARTPVASVRDELVAEAQALTERIRAQTQQAERLRVLAGRIEDQTKRDLSALSELEGVLGKAAQLAIDDLDQALGGQRLERVAIRIVQDRFGADAELHYREWFDLIRDAGYRIGGRNPLGTFLAQLNRSREIQAVGNRTGRYRLRLVS